MSNNNIITDEQPIKGVSFEKKSQKWRVRIYINGKEKQLGYFDNVKDANEVRRKAEKEKEMLLKTGKAFDKEQEDKKKDKTPSKKKEKDLPKTNEQDNKIGFYKDEVEKYKSKIKELEKKINALNIANEDLKASITCNGSCQYDKEVKTLKRQNTQYQNKIKQSEDEIKSLEMDIKSYKARESLIITSNKQLEDKIRDLKTENKKLTEIAKIAEQKEKQNESDNKTIEYTPVSRYDMVKRIDDYIFAKLYNGVIVKTQIKSIYMPKTDLISNDNSVKFMQHCSQKTYEDILNGITDAGLAKAF